MLSSWGSSNYRPFAPFLYEVASHVKNCHFGDIIIIIIIIIVSWIKVMQFLTEYFVILHCIEVNKSLHAIKLTPNF